MGEKAASFVGPRFRTLRVPPRIPSMPDHSERFTNRHQCLVPKKIAAPNRKMRVRGWVGRWVRGWVGGWGGSLPSGAFEGRPLDQGGKPPWIQKSCLLLDLYRQASVSWQPASETKTIETCRRHSKAMGKRRRSSENDRATGNLDHACRPTFCIHVIDPSSIPHPGKWM
jgi:hypothetical protein